MLLIISSSSGLKPRKHAWAGSLSTSLRPKAWIPKSQCLRSPRCVRGIPAVRLNDGEQERRGVGQGLALSSTWWLRRQSACLQCGRPGFDPWVGKDLLEKKKATHSSILAWKIPWTEEHGGLHTVHGVAKSWTQLSTHTYIHTYIWRETESVCVKFGYLQYLILLSCTSS